MKEYNIFIGSPSDVQEEREIIENTINEINEYYEPLNLPKLKLISLKTDVRSKIGNFDGQSTIDKQIEDKYNVFIGILWKNIGTETENHDSGTIQEFYNAYSKYEENPKSMEIMFYFCEKSYNPHEIDIEQLASVQKFRKKLENNKGLYKKYSSIEEFKDIIKNDLKLLVTEKKINFEESSENNDVEEENDGLIDLIEEIEEEFDEANSEMENLVFDINKFENELNVLNEQNKDNHNRDSMKKYFNAASLPITDLAENVDNKADAIFTHLNKGIDTLKSLIDIHGEFILNNEENKKIEEIEVEMNHCYDSINEAENSITDLLKVLTPIQSITSKFSRSKRKLEKSLQIFLKKLTEIQSNIKDFNIQLLEYKK